MTIRKLQARPGDRLVAVMIPESELCANHVATCNGVRQYAMENPSWRLVFDTFADYNLAEGGYSGVVGRATRRLAREAHRLGVPVVNVWMNSPVADQLPTVLPNAASAGLAAAEHLLGRGLRHFGLLGNAGSILHKPLFSAFRERVEAEIRDPRSCPRCLLPALFTISRRSARVGYRRLESWIESLTLPVGVLASHDNFAQILFSFAAAKYGLSVPHDLAMIGCANEPLQCVKPDLKLTSIDLNYPMIGYTAAKLLDSLMEGGKPPAEPVLIEPIGLVARQSTDILAVDEPIVARALRFIAENCHHHIQVDHVAEAASTSLRSLQRSFDEVVGRSISDQIEHLRVERAKRLLMESNRPVKILAKECGFGGYHHFYEVFKRREGLAPAEYRKRRRAQLA